MRTGWRRRRRRKGIQIGWDIERDNPKNFIDPNVIFQRITSAGSTQYKYKFHIMLCQLITSKKMYLLADYLNCLKPYNFYITFGWSIPKFSFICPNSPFVKVAYLTEGKIQQAHEPWALCVKRSHKWNTDFKVTIEQPISY